MTTSSTCMLFTSIGGDQMFTKTMERTNFCLLIVARLLVLMSYRSSHLLCTVSDYSLVNEEFPMLSTLLSESEHITLLPY